MYLAGTQLDNPSAPAQVLARMTLEHKAGQVLGLGFDGTTVNAEVRSLVEGLHVGALVYFERNVAGRHALAALSAGAQALAHSAGLPALIVCIDQEGGRVTRLRAAKGFTEFPSPQAVAAEGGPAAARKVGEMMAAELHAAGINMNLAPVLDVNSNPANPVINTRSFGSDPQLVAACGVAAVEALQRAGIMAVGKHFPGHGDTSTDSHLTLPVAPHDRTRLEAVEFLPFQAAIAADVAGILAAHIYFPAIEPAANLPGTFSTHVLVDLLRGELGHRGLVLTDALEMGALATSGYPPPEAAVRALAAGADLLLISAGLDVHRAAHARIVEAVRCGSIPLARLDAAVYNILQTKQRFGLRLA